MLARLFALDHIAARLRRNGENLLVLSGGEPGKAYNQAFPLAAVVTAAASEIEDFTRVEAAVGDMVVSSGAVADVVRVLAELLENATAFSPPDAPVRVDARRTIDGAIVRVHDSGIGITAARLSEINARLAQPANLTSAAAGTMGLHVVSHLAARHGIRVQLHPTGMGTVAYVMLPHSTLVQAPAMTPAVTAARGAPGERLGRTAPMEVSAVNRQALTSSQAPLPQAPVPPKGYSAMSIPRPAAAASIALPASARQVQTQVQAVEPAPAPQSLIPVQRQPGGGNSDYIGARVEAASQQPATWFHPYAGTGDDSAVPAVQAGASLVWATPNSDSAEPVEREAAPVTSPQALPSRTPAQSLSPQDRDQDSGGGLPILPRRRPGALLAPEVSAAPPAPAQPASIVDPDAVRARLSAFAEGVSAASRRSAFPSQATKDR